MLPTFSSIPPKVHRFKPVGSIFTQFLCTSNNASETSYSHQDLSPVNFSGIARTLISRCSHPCDIHKGENFSDLSLKDYFLKLSEISPSTVRRFWRIPCLKPLDVLEILAGFEPDCGKREIEVKKVACLWGIFKWVSDKNGEFEHLPFSCKIMASMLSRVGFYQDVECVLSRAESRGILLDCQEIFSNLIEGYVCEFELDKAISTYDRMRRLSLVPALSSYQALLKYLIGLNETQSMYRIYVDMINMGMERKVEEDRIHENVIRLLCIDGKVQEARDLVKKVMSFGIEPVSSVISSITYGYCKKKDFDDVLSFFTEMRIAPDAPVGNRILFSFCRDFGADRARLFMRKMEERGFCPDEITFGILIGFCCHEKKMKNAFVHLSEALSRSLKPSVYSYNALLSGIFVEGMWQYGRNILLEMNDMEVAPDLSTFTVLLAGFSKARQFDEVKAVISEMEDRGLIKLLSTEDPVTKAFVILGFNPVNVRIRRDNDVGLSKTEFLDNLGNGLYLDTDRDKYENIVDKVLETAMIPDFNSFLLDNHYIPDMENNFVVNEMERWGQEPALPVLSFLFTNLSCSSVSVKTVNRLLETMCKSIYQLHKQALNSVLQMYCSSGLTSQAKNLLDGMVRRHLEIESGAYSSLLLALCKTNDSRGLLHLIRLPRKYRFLLELEDYKALLSYLCQKKWFNQAFELFESMLLANPYNEYITFITFVEALCFNGLTQTALVLLKEFPGDQFVLDHSAYNHVIRAFCREGKFQDAFVILNAMLSKNFTPPLDVAIQLTPYLFATKNLEKAAALKDMCLKEISSASLSIHCAEEADARFREAFLNCPFPNVQAFNMLIQRHCQARNLRRVMELFGFMIKKKLSFSISSYRNLVRLLCMERMFPQALSLKQLVYQESNLPGVVVCNILLYYLFAARNTFYVDALIRETLKEGLQPDKVTYNFLIQGFIQCQDGVRPLQYLTSMISLELRPSNRSFRRVVGYLCKSNAIEKVLNVSREMEVRGWIHGSVVQNVIVEALLNNGKCHEALEFLRRMEGKGLNPDNIRYDHMIKQLCHQGLMDKAVDLLNMMLSKESVPECTSYDIIIQGVCKNCTLDLALDFYAEMVCRDLKPSMMTMEILVLKLCEDARVAEAEELLNSVIQQGETPSRVMFCSMIDKYRGEKNSQKTLKLLNVMQQTGYVPDFETHWSVVSNLSDSSKPDNGSSSRGFLANLLSGFGFSGKKP